MSSVDIVVTHSKFALDDSLRLIDQFREELYSSAPSASIVSVSGPTRHVCSAVFTDVTDLHRHYTKVHGFFRSSQLIDYKSQAVGAYLSALVV